MTDKEIEMCERLKRTRVALGIKQADFAKELTISQGHASDIENGRKSVSDRIVEIVVLKFGINEDWLRNGNGEMFVPKTRSESIAEFAGDLMKEEDSSFKRRLIEALAKLDESEWEMLEKLAESLANKKD